MCIALVKPSSVCFALSSQGRVGRRRRETSTDCPFRMNTLNVVVILLGPLLDEFESPCSSRRASREGSGPSPTQRV